MIISDQILLFAFQCNASDIHIIQGEEPTYRIDGQIRRLSQINESENINTQCHNGKLNDQIIQEVLDNCGISNKYLDEKKNIDFAYSVNNKRFRVNVYFERSRMAAAFRALPENMPSIENLYSDPNLATTLYKLANLPNGLVLVNGPTGSGKSSTLAAIINYINQNHPKSIITIEVIGMGVVALIAVALFFNAAKNPMDNVTDKISNGLNDINKLGVDGIEVTGGNKVDFFDPKAGSQTGK
jgi:twitching motility protein PilT